MKKFRKYEEGGSVREGRNENIDDDTRARAMEAVRRRMAGEDTEEPTTPAPRPRPKAPAPAAKSAAPAPSPSPSPSPAPADKADKEVPRAGNYRQEKYETPLKSAVRKYGPGVMDNLGKIAAGLGASYGAVKGGSKLIDAVRAADKGRQEAKLVVGNKSLADRMKGIVSTAEKDAASNASKRKMFEDAQKGKDYAQATEDRLTGLAMNPRRKNIPIKSSESGAPSPVKASRTKFNEDEVGVEFRRGGKAKCYAKGGAVRGGGCETRGKTKGRMV